MSDIITTIPCHLRTVRGLEEPRVFARNGKVLASSEDVAAFFGKQHNNVLRDIRTLISNDNSCALNFEWTQRDVAMPTGGKRQITICHMNRNGLTLLAMGFTGKRAIGWKIKYIEAFNAMEAALSKPQQVYDDEPAPKAKRAPQPIDQMDNALDLVMTAEAALRSKEWLDADVIAAVSGTLGQALKLFAPARTALNRIA